MLFDHIIGACKQCVWQGAATLGTRIRSRRNAPVHAGGLCCDGKRLPTEATSMRLKSIEK